MQLPSLVQSYKKVLNWFNRPIFFVVFLILTSLIIYRDVPDAFFWHDDFVMVKLVQLHTFGEYLRNGFDPSVEIYDTNIWCKTLWRPLTHYVYWAFGWRMFQDDPTGYHVTNLLIHVCNTLLVFGVAFAMLKRYASAFTAALMYTCAVIIHSETFYSLYTIHNSLLTLFILTSFLLYILRRQDILGAWASVLSVISYALAFGCKESAVPYPALLLTFDFLLNKHLPQTIRGKAKLLLSHTWPYWLLSISFVFTRLSIILGEVSTSGQYYSYEIGFGALTKYLWGFKWAFQVYVSLAQNLKELLLPSLHLNTLFGPIVLLVVVVIGATYLFMLFSGRSQPFFLRLGSFGVIWFLLFPVAIIFAKPFAAYLFVLPAVGLHILAGHLVSSIAGYIKQLSRVAGAAFYISFIILTIVTATLLAQEYANDPFSPPQQAQMSRKVLDWIRDNGYDVSQHDAVYLVGFPVDLFASNAEPKRTGDAFELYLGHNTQVKQVATIEELSPAQCGESLIFVYDEMNLMREASSPTWDCQPDGGG